MKLLAIDGNSIMNRAFYGIKMLSNKNGAYTNALTGFMNIYLKITGEQKPDAAACAFDLRAPTFRHKAEPSYKANRHGMPDELAQQMPVIKDLLRGLGVHVLETEGFEADDILGTLSKMCCDSGNECVILTGDRDSLQLVNDKVTVLLHGTKELKVYTPDKFREDYGLEPLQLIDLKALMGDSSDNISGVKGIGEKTALTLIKEHGSVEKLYEDLAEGKVNATKSVLAKLEAGKEDAERSKWLATIVYNAPIDGDIQSYRLGKTDEAAVSSILTRLEMYKLLEKLELKPAAVTEAAQTESKSAERIDYTVKGFEDGLFNEILHTDSVVSFIFTDEKLKLAYNGQIMTVEDKENQLKFLSCGCPKYAFQAKPAYRFCFENGCELKNLVADADILGYMLNTSSAEYTVEKMCAEYGSPYYDAQGENGDIASLPQLCEALYKEVKDSGMEKLFNEVEQPLTEVLASMEYYGVRVDTEGVKTFGERLSADISGIEQQIYFMAGHEFNIGSPKQLGTVLFEEMGLPAKKKTKTGYSTNAEVLEELRGKHEIIDLIMQYRQLTKLNSTYVDGLLKEVGADGRVHSVFKQTETKTGRISSTEPNMQNIPVRTELGRNMRKFFTAAEGYTLLDADYSQIELRILAAMSGDENMQKNFLDGRDIHTATAAQVFGMPPEMVTPEMRRAAKAVNFGIVYGIGAFSLSKDIDVSVAEADRYIKNYFANYPKIKEFMDNAVADASEKGYAVTMYGRRRYIPELKNSNKNVQAFGKRAAMNAPIQGTAADIIKIAMVKVYARLKKEQLDARLILQVHDELIIEVSEKDADKAAAVLGEEMNSAAKLAVPLTAEVEKGFTWYDAKG
ncbi:MAG: DNA polymerase I [Oscillospiraceae bacterium]|nr:DNA polymerase I [Oscillospiraceae bacterium]